MREGRRNWRKGRRVRKTKRGLKKRVNERGKRT